MSYKNALPASDNIDSEMNLNPIKRNLGLDIYRIILAYEVVFIHICNNSGGKALDGILSSKISYLIIQGGLTIAYPAVNGYALLSGYLGYNHKHSPWKALLMWLCLLFYSVVEYIIIELSYHNFTAIGLLKSFLPICNGKWWYINIYIILLLIMPLFDKALENLEEKRWLLLTGVLLGLICISNGVLQNKDVFYVYDGYSLSWIALLYFVGAGAKKYNIVAKMKKPVYWLLLWFASIFLTWSSEFFDNFFRVLNIKFKSGVLYNYPSVSVFTSAFTSLMFFVSLNIQKSTPFFSKLAKGSFAAYIIHVHNSFWNHCFRGKFSVLSQTKFVPIIILIDITFVFAASFVDLIRMELEKILVSVINRNTIASKQ